MTKLIKCYVIKVLYSLKYLIILIQYININLNLYLNKYIYFDIV